jgi:hypothetical protein
MAELDVTTVAQRFDWSSLGFIVLATAYSRYVDWRVVDVPPGFNWCERDSWRTVEEAKVSIRVHWDGSVSYRSLPDRGGENLATMLMRVNEFTPRLLLLWREEDTNDET